MRMRGTSGFTIIETMLFLAITGMLIVGLLAGTGTSINTQRYRDAAESLKTLLQNQYSALTSVHNDRDNTDSTWSCDATAATSQTGAGTLPGESECVLLGRYVTIVDSKITTASITGIDSHTDQTTGSDIDKLKANYKLNLSTIGSEETEMEWNTKIAVPNTNDNGEDSDGRSAVFLFIRSPDSGALYTFSDIKVPETVNDTSLKALLISSATIPGRGDQTLCINSNGLFVRQDLGIYISANANGPSSIETRTNDIAAAIPGAPKC